MSKYKKAWIFTLRLELANVKPAVWRLVQMPGDNTLDDVHELFQCAMGWTNSHLHNFIVSGKEYAPKWSEYDMVKVRDERRTSLDRAVHLAGRRFQYNYDFGDGWHHDVTVEQIRPWEKGSWVTKCLGGERACPPEDCSGPNGYERLLSVVADPSHKDHEELDLWLNGDRRRRFDRNEFDLEWTDQKLRWMSRDLRWSRSYR